MNNEVWKQLEDYPNYFVSNTGKIRNVKTGRELSQYLMPNGYLSLHLHKNNKEKGFLVHRLVAETFIDNSNNCDTVDHLNGIKTDNRAENLQWLSRSDNVKRFYEVQITEEQRKEFKTNLQKSIGRQVQCIETGKIYKSTREADKEYGFCGGTVSQVARGNLKSIHGLHFRYLLEDNDYE